MYIDVDVLVLRCSAAAEKMSSDAAHAAETAEAAAAAAATTAAPNASATASATAKNSRTGKCAINIDASVVAVVDRAAATSPLVDILQGGHDSLYSRLFSS